MSTTNGHLTGEQLLALSHSARKVVDLALPSGVGTVGIRALTGAERDELEEFIVNAGKSTAGMRGLMAALSLCDARGARLYASDDAGKLSESLAAEDLDAIFTAARKLSRIGTDELGEVQKN